MAPTLALALAFASAFAFPLASALGAVLGAIRVRWMRQQLSLEASQLPMQERQEISSRNTSKWPQNVVKASQKCKVKAGTKGRALLAGSLNLERTRGTRTETEMKCRTRRMGAPVYFIDACKFPHLIRHPLFLNRCAVGFILRRVYFVKPAIAEDCWRGVRLLESSNNTCY